MDVLSDCLLLTLVAEPLLSHLTVSGVTWDSVSISWEAQESAFDRFLIEVRNSDHLQDTVVHSVPGASRSFSSPTSKLLSITLPTFTG